MRRTSHKQRARCQLLEEHHTLATESARKHDKNGARYDASLQLGRLLHMAGATARDGNVIRRVETWGLARGGGRGHGLLPALAEELIPATLLDGLLYVNKNGEGAEGEGRQGERGRERGGGEEGSAARTAEWLKEGTPRASIVVRGLPARLLTFLGAIVSVLEGARKAWLVWCGGMSLFFTSFWPPLTMLGSEDRRAIHRHTQTHRRLRIVIEVKEGVVSLGNPLPHL